MISKGVSQALAGEIPALRFGQQAEGLPAQPAVPPLSAGFQPDLPGACGSVPLQSWQDAVPLGHANGSSFTFTSFHRPPAHESNLQHPVPDPSLQFTAPSKDLQERGQQQPYQVLPLLQLLAARLLSRPLWPCNCHSLQCSRHRL